MKAQGIKLVQTINNAIKGGAKAEKAVVSDAIKGGEKMMAAAQDAKAAQGRAMVNYQKPQMNEVKMDKKDLKAASGWDDGGYSPRGGDSRGEWGDLWADQGW